MARETPVTTFRTEDLLSQRTWLLALAARLVRDEAARDDLVQEAWLAALSHPRPGEKRDLGQWLGAVLRNRWRFERRTEARRAAREHSRGAGAPSPAAAELVEQAELQGLLVRAVLALEEPYRSTVLERYFGERTCRAIAREEGVPEGTVRSRLKRGLDLLRAELDRRIGGDRRAWSVALVSLARLAREKHALTSLAAVAAAAIAVLTLGWSWIGRAERFAPELSVATTDSAPSVGLSPAAQEPLQRAPLSIETTGTGHPSALVAFAHLELLVLDPENRPVADASVVCGADVRERALRTDERGACRVPDDEWVDSELELKIDAPGFIRNESTIARGSFSWSSPYPVTLWRAVALEGRLRDADNDLPIEHGELTLRYHGRILARATSGSDGSFLLEPAPRGAEVEVVVTAPAHAPMRRTLQVASTGRAYVDLALDAGVEIRGRVVNALSGAPLAGVLVYYSGDAFGYPVPPDEQSIELARTDAHGELVLRIPRGQESPDLMLARAGYCCQATRPLGDGFEVALLPSASIHGIVRDGEGTLLEDVEVMQARSMSPELRLPSDPALARLARVHHLPPTSRTTSDEAGSFRLDVVPWAFGIQIGYRPPGRSLELLTIEEPLQPGETRDLEIRLGPAGTIAGLLRINGEPSPGRVRCRAQGKDVASAWAGPDGRFEIRGVPPVRVALQAFPDEYERDGYTRHPHPVVAEVDVVAGQTKSTHLDVALSMGTIRGRVVNPAGKPRVHVSVSASAGGGHGYWRTVTDADGSFELHVPNENASYELCVQDVGPSTAVSPNAEAIEIVRAGYGRLRLRSEDVATGRVIEGANLFVRRGSEWESWGGLSTGTNGFVQWELEAGTLELAVGKPDEGFPTVFLGRFTLVEDAELELEAPLERVGPLQFVLTNPPLPEACGIRLENPSGLPMVDEHPVHYLLLRKGPESVPGIAAGDYRISAGDLRHDLTLDDVVVEPAQIRISAERSKPIELTWRRK